MYPKKYGYILKKYKKIRHSPNKNEYKLINMQFLTFLKVIEIPAHFPVRIPT